MTSLTERLAGKDTRQDMEYEEKLVHNVLAIAWNAIILVAKKVDDNVLHMMTAPVIVPQPAILQNPAANLLCALVKAPNALIIKQVCMALCKLKATKPWPEPAKAQTQ